MSIEPRRPYRLRASPAVGQGGMYAVLEGQDVPLRLGPLVPPFMERMAWQFVPLEGRQDVYRIMFAPFGPAAASIWKVPEAPQNDQPVITTVDMGPDKGWIVQPFPFREGSNAVTIRPEVNLIGMQILAGPGSNAEVQLTFLPIDLPQEALPYWVLEPVQPE